VRPSPIYNFLFGNLNFQFNRPDAATVFVNVGLGFHVEFTPKEALTFIERKEGHLSGYLAFPTAAEKRAAMLMICEGGLMSWGTGPTRSNRASEWYVLGKNFVYNMLTFTGRSDVRWPLRIDQTVRERGRAVTSIHNKLVFIEKRVLRGERDAGLAADRTEHTGRSEKHQSTWRKIA
jgi:hypothetical protein